MRYAHGVVFFVFISGFAISDERGSKQYDCSVLDPRVELSSNLEGKVRAGAETAFKVAKADGEVSAKVSSVTQNIQKDIPLTERGNATNRFLYLFCEMMSKESFSSDKKFEMYKVLLDRFVPPNAPLPQDKKKSPGDSKPKLKPAPDKAGESVVVSVVKSKPQVKGADFDFGNPQKEAVSVVPVRAAFFLGKPISVLLSPGFSKRIEPIRFVFTLKNNAIEVSGVYFKMTQSPELSRFYSAGDVPRALMVLSVHDKGSLVGKATYCCWKVEFESQWPSVFSSAGVVATLPFPFSAVDAGRDIKFTYGLVFVRDGWEKRFDADVGGGSIWGIIDSGVVVE